VGARDTTRTRLSLTINSTGSKEDYGSNSTPHRQLLGLSLYDQANRFGGNDAAWSAALQYISMLGLMDWSAIVGEVIHTERSHCFKETTAAPGTIDKKYQSTCMIASCNAGRAGGRGRAGISASTNKGASKQAIETAASTSSKKTLSKNRAHSSKHHAPNNKKRKKKTADDK
jgi:hypothetical protein